MSVQKVVTDVILSILILGASVLMVACLGVDIRPWVSCPTSENLVSSAMSQQDRPAVGIKHTDELLTSIAGCREDHTPSRACMSFSRCILSRKVLGTLALPWAQWGQGCVCPSRRPTVKELVHPVPAGVLMLHCEHNRQWGATPYTLPVRCIYCLFP